MEILSVSVARSVWLFPVSDLNPHGRYSAREMIDFVAERYKFEKYPKSLAGVEPTDGIKLEHGVFNGREGQPVAVAVTMYLDGVIAETRSSTADCDAFLDDCLMSLVTRFKFADYKDILRRKQYVSELYVRPQRSLSLFQDKLQRFADKLNSAVVGRESVSFHPAVLHFWNDPGSEGRPTIPFRFERAETFAFSENRYYTIAPLQTELHISLLNDLENILAEEPLSSDTPRNPTPPDPSRRKLVME